MSDIIECPDEEVVDAVLGVLRERMPDRIARINELHPDDNTISMLDLHDGYVEPALATRFPMGCVWTQQGDFDEETRVMTRDTITVRILIALRERPMTARRKMYRYLACILNIVHSDARLKDADGVPRVEGPSSSSRATIRRR